MHETRSTEFRRGWRIVVAGAVGTAFGISALPFYTLGVFTKPVIAEFGWSREAFQLGFAVQMLGLLAVSWLWGGAVDRVGARRVALVSQLGLGLGLMGLSLTTSLAHWYVAWGVVALLGAGTSPLTWTRGIAGWFDSARGTALGLALVGTGVTGFLAPMLVTPLIGAAGWRTAYAAMGLSVIVLALPVAWWLFRDAAPPPGATKAPLMGVDRRTALGSARFWVMLGVFTLVTFGVGGIIPNLVPLLTDKGLSAERAAGFAGLAGLAVVIGRVGAGFLLDRFWAPAVAVGFLVVPAVGCLVLAGETLPPPLMIGLSAALVGLAAGAEFDLVAYLVTRYFGMRHYGFLYAIQMGGLLLAGGLAPAVFGRVFDATGSYAPALHAAAAIFALAPLLLLTMGRYPDLARR